MLFNFKNSFRNHSVHCFLTILKVFHFLMFTVECKPGYAGPNCSFNCPHPTYGDGCQGTCECSKDECDSVTGCKPMSSGT